MKRYRCLGVFSLTQEHAKTVTLHKTFLMTTPMRSRKALDIQTKG